MPTCTTSAGGSSVASRQAWNSELPGGVFNRGFVRAVARYLGLDEENLVAEYASAVGDRPTVPVWTGSPPAVTLDRPWLAWILTAVVVLVLAMAGWFGMRRIFAWRASRHAAQIAAHGVALSPEQPDFPSANKSVPRSADSAQTPSPDSSASPRGTDSSLRTSAGPISPATPVPFELKVEADKPTRVTVDADTHRVFEGMMKTGESHVYTARDRIQVSASDAGAVLLELNGKTLSPIGPPGHEGNATFTRESLKGTAGGGN